MAIAGRVGIVPKGPYVIGNTYTRLDLVSNNNCIYLAKIETSTEPIGTEDTDEWMFIIESDRQSIDDLLESYTYNLLPNGTDFNNLTSQGNHYMRSSNTYTNAPPNIANGFVDVKVWGVVVKQIVWKQGTIGKDDYEIYERTGLTSNGTWSEWTKIMTDKNLTTSLAVTEEGSPLDATVGKVLNDKITTLDSEKSNVLSGVNGIKVDDKLSGKLWFLIVIGGGSSGTYSANAIGVGGTVYSKSDSNLGISFANGIMQLTKDNITIANCKLFY